MKYWVAFSFGISLMLIACASITIGVMADGWQKSADAMWSFSSSQIQENLRNVIHDMLSFLKFSASSVPYFTPSLYTKSVPPSGFDPTLLIRMYDTFNRNSGFNFNSFGFLRRINSTSNAKESYQIAKFYLCPNVIWAYSDPSINPEFVGYCVDENDSFNSSKKDYEGFDWGLKPNEAAILDGKLQSSFLPLFNLLGNFTLTYEMSWKAGYAVTFAEMDVTLLSRYVSNLSILGGKGIIHIYENPDGLMVASTDGKVVYPNGTRYRFQEAPNSDYIVNKQIYVDTGINWTIQISILQRDIYGDMRYFLGVSIGISFAVLVCFVILTFVAMKYWISSPFNDILKKLRGEQVSPSYNRWVGDDLLPIQENVFSGTVVL